MFLVKITQNSGKILKAFCRLRLGRGLAVHALSNGAELRDIQYSMNMVRD